MKACLALRILFIFLILFSFLDNAHARPRRKRAPRPLLNYSIGGSYKSIVGYQRLRQQGIFPENTNFQTEQRFRLNLEISRGPWRLEVADQLSIYSQNANPSVIPLPPERPQTAWAARQHPIDKDSLDIINQIDRAYLEFKRKNFEIRIGKQVVAAGVGKIFQAISQTPRQAFVIVNPEYPITEDAAIIQFKGDWTLEGRFLPKTPLDQKPSFHLVAKGTKGGYDVALTAGRSNDKAFIGLETAGNLGDSLVRAEAVGYQTNKDEGYAQFLLGMDRYFTDWSVQTEIFYNGFGSPNSADYSVLRKHRPTPYQGRLYWGMGLDWTLHPLVELKTNAVLNLNDLSALFHLSLSYSLSRNFELMAGQFFLVGENNAEFGGMLPVGLGMTVGLPDMTYFLLKFYF